HLVPADAHPRPVGAEISETGFATRMLNAAGRIDDVLREIARFLRPDGSVVVLTRARPRPDDDRLDPENGEQRLALHFAEVIAEREGDAAIFVARKKRVR